MKIIILKSIVSNTSTNEQGGVLFNVFAKAVKDNEPFILQVSNDQPLSTSFLNTSVGKFLELYGTDTFKEHIKFKGNRAQFERISNYVDKYKKLYLDT